MCCARPSWPTRPGARKNTGDNTPAVVHFELVPGDKVDVRIGAKGGGSENKARFAMLNPSDDVVEWVLSQLPGMGAGWCPPGVLGIGIGGTAEKAMLLAKESLMQPIDMTELKARGAANRQEELRIEICDKVNALGIGAQGLGGLTTVLDVKILDYPTHAASKPVAMIPNCAATRHIHFELDGSGGGAIHPAEAGGLSRCALAAGNRCAAGESGYADAGRDRTVAAGRNSAVVRQAAHRARCGA